jgi:hypothetical protein
VPEGIEPRQGDRRDQEAPRGARGLNSADIERLASRDEARIAAYFLDLPPAPCIFTDATADWPARGKWTLDFFAANYADVLGIASLSFDQTRAGKATKLGTFIEHLDKPYADLPGFWIGPDKQPTELAPDYDEAAVWSFGWKPFEHDRALLDDISPFPRFIPNITANLPRDVYDALQTIQRIDFHAIYISRRDTVTRLHDDFNHTFGCLAQFEGAKTVVLLAPGDYRERPGPRQFNPEQPDFEEFPELRDATAYRGVLQPGEMLIIPPGWWHYTRAHDHSVTLSHNFFNAANFAAYMRCILSDMWNRHDPGKLVGKLRALLDDAA